MTISRRRFVGLTGVGLGGIVLRPSVLLPAPEAYFNRRMPDEFHTQMGNLSPGKITAVAFTPSNGWVIVNQSGGLFARGIPDECFAKLGEYVQAGHIINSIGFPAEGGNRWVITTNKTFFARNIPDECYQKLLACATPANKSCTSPFLPVAAIAGSVFLPAAVSSPAISMTSAFR